MISKGLSYFINNFLSHPFSLLSKERECGLRRTKSLQKIQARAVQDYDLYLIQYNYFELLWLQYDSPHILSSLITVKYNMIWWSYSIIIIMYSSATKMHNSGTILACMCHIWSHRDYFSAGTPQPYIITNLLACHTGGTTNQLAWNI